jgi:hypothetical protein
MELRRDIDPKLARFLARHSVSVKEEVEADVAPHRGEDPADSWATVEALCRDAVFLLKAGGHGPAVMREREEPHPSYWPAMRRLMAERRARSGDRT